MRPRSNRVACPTPQTPAPTISTIPRIGNPAPDLRSTFEGCLRRDGSGEPAQAVATSPEEQCDEHRGEVRVMEMEVGRDEHRGDAEFTAGEREPVEGSCASPARCRRTATRHRGADGEGERQRERSAWMPGRPGIPVTYMSRSTAVVVAGAWWRRNLNATRIAHVVARRQQEERQRRDQESGDDPVKSGRTRAAPCGQAARERAPGRQDAPTASACTRNRARRRPRSGAAVSGGELVAFEQVTRTDEAEQQEVRLQHERLVRRRPPSGTARATRHPRARERCPASAQETRRGRRWRRSRTP